MWAIFSVPSLATKGVLPYSLIMLMSSDKIEACVREILHFNIVKLFHGDESFHNI